MIARRVLRAVLVLALIAAGSFLIVAPPERCPTPSEAELRASSQEVVDWFVRVQRPSGSWVYEYDKDEDTITSDYNEVRHAGVTMGLYQAAAAGLPGAMRSADRGTDWALRRLVRRHGWAGLAWEGEIATGATALLAAGLAIRREATGDDRYDDVLRRLGRFLVAQTEPSGAVLKSYGLFGDAPVPDVYSKYYTGEAYWALALLHDAFPGEGWGETADRIGAYLATSRDETEGHFPPVPDHWAAYGAAETVEFPEREDERLTDDEVRYARDQAGLFGPQARWVAQRYGPWGELVRGTYTPRGGGYGVMGEALTGWWLAAQAEPQLGDIREPAGERATCIAGLAIEAQSDAEDAAGATRPELVRGAWYLDGTTRMDDQQHALAGLLRTIPIVRTSESGGAEDGSGPDQGPSWWLWAAVLLLALNPARAAFAVPRAGRSQSEAVRLAAAGGAIGGLAVCVTGLLGDPLLDLLDVSDPSFRVAAGVVAALTGAIDVFRRPPPQEPSLPGRRAALVPVAFPAVARPALLVIALGAGAEEGIPVCVAAMAMGTVLLAGLTAAVPVEGTAGGALRWASRVLAAGLLACGVVLTLSGITDV